MPAQDRPTNTWVGRGCGVGCTALHQLLLSASAANLHRNPVVATGPGCGCYKIRMWLLGDHTAVARGPGCRGPSSQASCCSCLTHTQHRRGHAPGTDSVSLQMTGGTQVTRHVKAQTVQPARACRQPLPGVWLYFSAAQDLSGKSCTALSVASGTRL